MIKLNKRMWRTSSMVKLGNSIFKIERKTKERGTIGLANLF